MRATQPSSRRCTQPDRRTSNWIELTGISQAKAPEVLMSGKHDVLLINMPFSYFLSPSIGLGLLKASLTRNQIDSKVLYLNIKFAELIGQDDYLRVLSGTFTEDLAGEWVFSDSLFKDGSASGIESYLNNVLRAQPLSTLAPQKYEDPVLIQ